MKRLDLYSRIKGGYGRAEGEIRKHPDLEHLCKALGGRIISEGKSRILISEQVIPHGYTHGNVRLRVPAGSDLSLLSLLFPAIEDSCDISPGDLLFFDIETTGLSGGAGIYVFLAGFLVVEDKGYSIRQYFLDSFSSERFFLSFIEKEFLSRRVLVSYNGKSFDYGIIRNRSIMNGLTLHEIEPVHIDLLYPSRRIWKGMLSDYSLPTVEQGVLRLSRGRDIPAMRIPEVYADYLRGRDVLGDIISVFYHNRNDVISLLALLTKQMSIISGVEGSGEVKGGVDSRETQTCENFFNPFALSDLYCIRGRTERARELLLRQGNCVEALRRLGIIYKKERSYGEALSCFRLLAEKCVELRDYFFACSEAAKIFEHVFKDLNSAMIYTKKIMDRMDRMLQLRPGQLSLSGDEVVDARRRFSRLMQKLERQKMI